MKIDKTAMWTSVFGQTLEKIVHIIVRRRVRLKMGIDSHTRPKTASSAKVVEWQS